jgi:uncharacterized membrane protein YkoI
MHHRRTKHNWRPRWHTWFLLLAAVALVSNGNCLAGDDHDRARQALEAGEVLPLRTILDHVEREYPGQVIDVELERSHDNDRKRWIYEVKILRSGGALVKLKVDATDGRIIARKARNGDRH